MGLVEGGLAHSHDVEGSGDVIDSSGKLIKQTIDESAQPQGKTTEEFIDDTTTEQGEICPDDTYEEDEGDPDDALGKEDPDNDPANDGCNQPECPTPSVCDTEPIESDCTASVNVSISFYGLKLFGQVIGTIFHKDQYCFNSDSAATDFFNKMVIIDNAQPKPSLGDTQISLNVLSLIRSGGVPPCNDLSNPRPDAALLSYKRFGPIGLFGFRITPCGQETDPVDLPVVDPCVPPDYLDA